MITSHVNNVKAIELPEGPYSNVIGRVLISPETGWDDYVMRMFELRKNGFTADHAHDFPHYVFVLEGTGEYQLDDEVFEVESGSFALIPNNHRHQLRNNAKDETPLKFICIVPKEGHVPFE